MALGSSIEWTQATWNPVTGCTKVSTGCANCYAERFALRLKHMGNPRYRSGFQVTLHSDLIQLPLKWSQPRLIFVNSMSDLFHEAVPFDFIKSVFTVIQSSPRHTFQLLTKRAERLSDLSPNLPWPRNLWVGVSVETQEYAWRIECLRRVPAAVKFVSCEPLLGRLNIPMDDLQWVIVGGESGPRARSVNIEWIRSIRDQCTENEVAFFLKQLGGVKDKRAKEQAVLDGHLWKEWPSVSNAESEDVAMPMWRNA